MSDKNIAILGAGESGVGAALLAQARGYTVFVSDSGKIKTACKQELLTNRIPFEEGGHSDEKILAAALVVKSPGISDTAAIVRKVAAAGLEIISEIEFAFRHTNKPVIGITGSNGKTTTTLLIHHLLTTAGYRAALAGNVGSSLARHVLTDAAEVLVVELSSFQLDGIVRFRPRIAVLLNITPDHLDRYDNDFEKYARAKLRICKNMTAEDLLVYNLEDAELARRRNSLPGHPEVREFSLTKATAIRLADDDLVFDLAGEKTVINKKYLPLPGAHNQLNMLAAITVALTYGIGTEVIIKALSSFANHPHRLEYITEINGIAFYNDSKATNVEAVYYALGSFDRPIVWIAGGQDKGNDYTLIKGLVAEKVKAMVCLGLDNAKLIDTFKDTVPEIAETQNAGEAAAMAYTYANAADVVVLSPACASFDLFENYAQRGDMFKEAVLNLKKKVA